MPNSIEKAMLILRTLSDTPTTPVTLAEIAARTGIPKSTAAHIIKTLTQGRYIRRISHSAGYTVGPELYFLTRYGRYEEDIIAVCHPLLRYLSKMTGGTAIFVVLRDGEKYIIDRADGNFHYPDDSAKLIKDDIYRTGTGRYILSFMREDQALAQFEQLGVPEKKDWPEVTDRESFLAERNRIRGIPYIHSTNRQLDAISVPVTAGDLVGSIGLVIGHDGEHPALNAAQIEKIGSLMLRVRREAERRLRFT